MYLKNIIGGFNMKKVIVIGTYIIDLLLKGYDINAIKPDNITFLDSCKMSIGGNAGNVAVNLKKYDFDVQVLGRVARDKLGSYIIRELEDLDVICNCMQFEDDCYTGVSIVFIENNGEKAILQYVGANHRLSFQKEGLYEDADAVIITGLGLIPEIEEHLVEITDYFKKKDMIIIADTSANTEFLLKKFDSRALSNIDYFMINEREILDLTNESNIEDAAQILCDRGSKNVIVKMGERGAYCFGSDKNFYKEAVKTGIVDTTGAGDAFLAGFTYALLNSMDIETCVEIANMEGASCVRKIGSTSYVSAVV